MRVTIAAAFLCAIPLSANATIADYCAAYARDMADQTNKTSPQWQRRFDNAEAFCNSRFAIAEDPKPTPRPKVKPVVKAQPEKVATPKIKPIAEQEPELLPDPKQVKKTQSMAALPPRLNPGSPEWLDYCKNKYTSFDESKGTYTSRTGVERKCLVTAE